MKRLVALVGLVALLAACGGTSTATPAPTATADVGPTQTIAALSAQVASLQATIRASTATPSATVAPGATPTPPAAPTAARTPEPPAAPTAMRPLPTATAAPAPTPVARTTASRAQASAIVPAPGTSPPTTGQLGALEVEVRIIDFAFDPPVIAVPVGTTVTWVLVEGYHTVLSADARLDSLILERPGDRYARTLTEAGLYDYLCGIHPEMLGVVTVEP